MAFRSAFKLFSHSVKQITLPYIIPSFLDIDNRPLRVRSSSFQSIELSTDHRLHDCESLRKKHFDCTRVSPQRHTRIRSKLEMHNTPFRDKQTTTRRPGLCVHAQFNSNETVSRVSLPVTRSSSSSQSHDSLSPSRNHRRQPSEITWRN